MTMSKLRESRKKVQRTLIGWAEEYPSGIVAAELEKVAETIAALLKLVEPPVSVGHDPLDSVGGMIAELAKGE
jgi:hypothetical protein